MQSYIVMVGTYCFFAFTFAPYREWESFPCFASAFVFAATMRTSKNSKSKNTAAGGFYYMGIILNAFLSTYFFSTHTYHRFYFLLWYLLCERYAKVFLIIFVTFFICNKNPKRSLYYPDESFMHSSYSSFSHIFTDEYDSTRGNVLSSDYKSYAS